MLRRSAVSLVNLGPTSLWDAVSPFGSAISRADARDRALPPRVAPFLGDPVLASKCLHGHACVAYAPPEMKMMTTVGGPFFGLSPLLQFQTA